MVRRKGRGKGRNLKAERGPEEASGEKREEGVRRWEGRGVKERGQERETGVRKRGGQRKKRRSEEEGEECGEERQRESRLLSAFSLLLCA